MNTALLEKNLEFFNTNTAAKLREIVRKGNEYKIEVAPSRQNLPVPMIQGTKGKIGLHSSYAPLKEAERFAGNITTGSTAVIIGLGAAYHIDASINRNPSHVIVIEPDALLAATLLNCFDYSRLLSNQGVSLIIRTDERTIWESFPQIYNPVFMGDLDSFILTSYRNVFKVEVEKVFAELREAVHAVTADYSSQAFFASAWISNTIKNHALEMNRVQSPPRADSVVITAAGPTLDRDIDLLRKESGDGAFILATDTSVPALTARGIGPDAVISIDSQIIGLSHFLERVYEKPVLIAGASVPPPTARRFRKVCFLPSHNPFEQLVLPGRPVLDCSGGNVTYAALHAAYLMGAKKIRVLGADYFYTGGCSYCRGSHLYTYFRCRETRLAPAASGMTGITFRPGSFKATRNNAAGYASQRMNAYKKAFEEQAQRLYGTIDYKTQGNRRFQYVFSDPVKTTAQSRWNAGFSATRIKSLIRGFKSLTIPSSPDTKWFNTLIAAERAYCEALIPLAAKHLSNKIDTKRALEMSITFIIKKLEAAVKMNSGL